MRMRKKRNLIPRMERCAALLVREPWLLRGRWRDEFPGYKELHLEIGCGRGRFTVETAKLHPDVFFVALERVADAMIIGLEKAMAEGLRNIRFMTQDASNLLEFFADGEVDRIYLNFSDPWPGKRHAKRRLTSERFLPIYKKILRPGGEIHFKTDNPELFDYSLGTFREAGFALSEITRNLHENGPVGVMTDYEMKFYAQGVSICRCVATFLGEGEQPAQDDGAGRTEKVDE
ncbi:MAG: tRNA (guanosine(46)-N7)-methyltransferase TrmB [Clostridiales bacterium]|nr:tRNA (guanosine(46)-N7)-methyltransferase TrmB [Clostridiales bacterium]